MRRVLPSPGLLSALVSLSGAPALSPSLPLQRRRLSSQASRWISELRYGAEGPIFGSFGSAFSDGALTTRQMYCKALVFASGGSRRSRDWIAGCSAMSSPNQTLLTVALQYTSTEADVIAFREHIIGRLLQADGAGPGSPSRGCEGREQDAAVGSDAPGTPSSLSAAGTGDTKLEGESFSPPQDGGVVEGFDGNGNGDNNDDDDDDDGDETAKLMRRIAWQLTGGQVGGGKRAPTRVESSCSTVAGGDSSAPRAEAETKLDAVPVAAAAAEPTAILYTPEEVERAEALLLSASPEVRCFLYDAMTASLFHCHGDAAIVEEARRRVFQLGTTYFGVDDAVLRPLWRTVEAELMLRKKKVRLLGKPWGE